MATEGDAPQDQSTLAKRVEKEDGELLTRTSGMEVDKHFQVEEKKVQTHTKEPSETMKTNSEVETAKELVAGNQGPRDGEIFLESPRLIPIAGEENSSSLQDYKGKDMINGADREKSKTNLIDEEELQYQEVEVTAIEASLPGTQPNAEVESQVLNRDETRCVVREETTMHLQEATSEQTPEEKEHLPDSTRDINLEAAKLFVSANQGAGQQKIFNTSTVSFEDPQEAGPPIKEEKDSAILSILHSKTMEPQGPHSSLNVEDETTKKVNFPSGIEDESDHREVPKENFQDVEVQPHLLNVKDEPTEKAKNLSSFLRILSSKKECGSSHSEATERNPQDAEMLPLSVIMGHETANEVASLSKHTGHASRVIECSKEHSETTEGNTEDVERLLHSINMEHETTKEAEISSDLANNASIARESGTDDHEVIEGTSEDPKILPHSVLLEDETTEEVERFSEHTSTVSTETEYGTDPVTKANIRQAEILSPVEAEDQNMEKAGKLSVLARNVSKESGSGIYHFEAAKAETSEDIEITSVNSLITPSMTGTSILEAEPDGTSCEIKSNDNGNKKEIFELKRPDLQSANVSVSSGTDCPNKHEKEDIENGSPAEKVSSPVVDSFTEEVLLRDVGQEKVQELEAHSGTMFEKEDGNVKDTSDIKPAPVKEVSGIVPIVGKENQAEVGNLNTFLEEVATVKSTESAMVEAEDKPESSSNDSVMEKRETSEKETQEKVIVELLAGEDTKDEVSKGLTEANIDVKVPVIPEIFNTHKDLAPLFKTEPGKENHSESLKAARMSLEKIDSSQHFERKTSVQEERSIECSEGGLCEEKESTSNASKSKAEESLQENTTIDGSNKEIDSAVLNDTAQETEEADQCPESTILEELPPEETSQELRSTTEAEDDKHEKNDLIVIEDKTQQKDFPSRKDETFAPQSYTDSKRKLVEDSSVGNNRTKCLKGGEDYISDYEEIKSNDLEEAASELKEDHVAVKEAAHPEANDVHKGEAIYSNDDEEIKGRGSDEGAQELKEDQSVAKEACKDTMGKHEEEEMQTVDKEATNPEVGNKGEAFYSNHNEEIKGHDSEEGPSELKNHIVAEEANKDTCSKDEEKEAQIRDDKEEVAAAEHVETNPEADDIHKGEVYSNDNEEIKAKDSAEGAQELKDYEILAKESHKETFSKDDGRETQITDKEKPTAEFSVAEENKSDHEIKTKETNPEADEIHNRKADHHKEDKDIEDNDSEEGTPEPEEDQIAIEVYKEEALELKVQISAEKVDREIFRDDKKKTEIIENEKAATELVESFFTEENQSDHMVTSEGTNPEGSEVNQGKADHLNDNKEIEGNVSVEGAPEPKEDQTAAEVKEGALELKDQVSAEQVVREILREDDRKETKIIEKEEAGKELEESSFAEEIQSDREVTSEVITPEAGEVHQAKPDHLKDNKETEGNYSEEVAPEPKECQISAEEVHKDTFRKDEEKVKKMMDKQEVATEYLVETSVTEENKSSHKLLAVPVNPEAGVHKHEGFYSNSDEKIKSIHAEEGAAELKEDQVIEEEANKETFGKDEKKGPQIIDKEVAATEYLVESSLAEENKFDKAYKDTFSKDEEKEMQFIHKQEVATEYSVESSVAEEGKSGHEFAAEETNLEAEKLHKAKVDHLNDCDVKDNDSDKEAPEPKEDQLQKDEEKEPQVMDKEEGATENSEEFCVADNKFDHEVTTKSMNTEDDDDNKGEAVYRNDDENMKGNESDKEAAEPKEDQILAQEVIHTRKDTLFKDAEKETKNTEEEGAKEYLTESYVAEENKSDHKVTTEETDPEDNDVYKQAVHRNDDDEEIKGIDSEEGAPELKQYQILAEEVCKDTFSKDKKKDAQIIEKREIAIHYLLESSVAEENKSDHMVKKEAKIPESDESHKGKVDHPNDDEVIEGNDPEVAPELNEDQIVKKEVYEEASSKDVENETQTTDKEKVVTGHLVPSIVETEKPTHEVVIEETKKEASDIHYGAENLDAVEEKKSQKALQESILEDIIAEDRMMTQVPSLEKTKEEFRSECDIVTSSVEEIKIEDSCEENRKGELDRERISQHHDIEKQISKENDSSKDCHTKSLKDEIVQESFQDAEANKQKSADIQMNIEEILNLTIPIPTQGERSIEGSLKNEEGNIMEPEKETKDMDIEGTTKNDVATYTAKEGEKVTVKNEENAGVAGDIAGTLRLTEGLSPTECQGQAENSSTVPKISAKRDEKMSEIMESAEIWPVEGSLKKKEWNVLKPQKKREGEMEAVKEERNADVAGDTAGTTRISEGLPRREYQEQGSIAAPEISEESKEEMLEVIQYAQEGEMEAVKEERNAEVAGDTAGTTRISEGLPPREYQEQGSIAAPEISEESKEEVLVDNKVLTEIRSVEGSLIQEDWNVTEPEKEKKDLDKEGTMQDDDATLSAQENERGDGLHYENSSREPDISEETKEKMLDATESAGIRPIKETLKQEEQVVVEQEKETKDLHVEGTTQNDEATHTAREGETKMVKHEGSPYAADVGRLIKGFPQREYQEFSENSSVVLDISEERNETRLDTTESKGIKLVEGNSKKEEWDVKKLEEEISDLDREGTAQKDKATLSAQDGEKETVKHEGNPNITCTNRLIEEFPPKKYQEHAENSSGMIDMSEEWSKKILDTTESTELRKVEETLKQEERVVMEQEKETEDLHKEGIMQNDDTLYIVEEGEKEVIRHEGNENSASTDKLAVEDQPENCSEVTELSVKSREKMPDTMEQTAIRSEEGGLKQEEQEKEDVEMEMVKREANSGDISDTVRLAKGLPPREYQEEAENSNSAPKTEQGKEKMLDSKVSTESEGSLKQEEWDVMGLEKEKKDLNREGIIQNDKARLLVKVAEKDTIKHEGIPEVRGTDGLTEEFPEREYQKLAQKSSVVPAISNEMNEKMLETNKSTKMRLVGGTSKQEECIPMEQGKETKYLYTEGKTQNDEATHTAEEGQKDTFKHEGNAEAPNTDRLTKGLHAGEYQELAEYSTAVPDISEERNKTMPASMESKEIKLVEGSLKENEWNVMEPEKAKKDLVREGTTEKDALYAKEGEKDTVKHKGNPDAEGTNELTEELPAREHKELAENSSVLPDISKERNNKMLDATGKETKDFDREGKTQKDEATLSAKEVEKETVKNEGSPDAASINVLTEELPAKEYQALAGNSNVMPDITKQRNEKMLDITESIEIRPTKESLKQKELEVMELQKETKDTHKEGTIQNDGATHSAHEGEKETVKTEGNANTAGTNRLAEELLPRELQELTENSSTLPEISQNISNEKELDENSCIVPHILKERNNKMLDTTEKETKDVDKEGKAQKDEATLSAKLVERDTVKNEGNPDAASINGLTEELPASEYQELAKNFNVMPDITKQKNEKMLDITESIEIRPTKERLKQKELEVMKQEKETKDSHEEDTIQHDEATHSAYEGEKETVKNEGNANTAGTNRLAEELLPREHQELTENSSTLPEISPNISNEKEFVENSSVVPDISKERNNKMLDARGKETKDFDQEGKTQKDEATLSAKEVEKDTVKNEGSPDAASINGLTEELPAREYQEFAENSNVMPDIAEQRNEKMLEITDSIEIRPTKESLKQKELEIMEQEIETKDSHEEGTLQNDEATHSAYESEKESVKNEGNANTAGTNKLAEELLPREHQELTENSSILPEISPNISNEKELAENSSVVHNISKERNNKMLDTAEKETKDFDREEGKTQKDEATLSAKKVEKDTYKNEGSPDAASILLTEELPAREYRELAENSSAMPDITEQWNEKMQYITESIEIRSAKESLKQKEWKVMEKEKETKYLHEEGKEQNDEATHSAHEAEKETVKNERNTNAAGNNRIAEELLPREHQELTENSSTQHEISEKCKERMLDITESAETIKDEKSSKQEECNVMGSGKETRDLDKEATRLNDDATLSAQEGGKEMIKHAGYSGNTATDMLTEGLPPRECQEFAQNTSEVPEITEKSKEKMLDIMELTQIIRVEEILNQEEWNVMEPEKDTKDLDKGMTMKDSATLSAQEGGKETIKHEGIQDDALTNRLTEQLPPREYQELVKNSSVMPHMSEGKNELMSDTTEFKEIEPVEGSSKNEELDVMEPEKTRDLHKEATTLNHEVRISAQEGKKETVKHVGNPAAAVTHRLTEELPPRECQEPAANSNAVADIPEKREKTMLDTIAAKEIKLVERSSKQEEWDVIEPEKETKDLDREGRIQKDEATISAKEAVKHEENQDAAGTNRLTIKGLPLRDYKELGENSTIVADITEERNKKMLDTRGSTEINPVEGISKQEEWDIIEPEKEAKDLHKEGTTQNDEAAKMVEHEGIANAAVTDRPAEELPGREYQELSENSSKVPETSEKMLDTMESTERRHPEGSLKQEEWDVIKPENQTKDSDRDCKTDNDEATCSAHGGKKEMVKHEGIPDAVGSHRLTEVLPPTEFLDLAENSSVVPHISEEGNQKMLDITEATVKIPVEGRLKQDKLDVPEPEKKTKDVDIEVTALNDEATHHFAQESTGQKKDVDLEVTALNNETTHFSGGETNTIEHEGKSDREGGTAVTFRFPQREYKELAKFFSAMPRVSGKSKEKMLENMEPTEIAVMGETKEVKLHENTQIDNNTPTPEKLDQEDALEPEVQPGSQTFEISEFIMNSRESAKMPRKDDAVGDCSQNSAIEEKDAINKETTRISELKEDGKSQPGNINSEIFLNEMVDSIEVLYPETDEDSHAQENIGRKDSEVNITSTSAEPVLDNVTAREYQELVENSSMVPDILQGNNEKMLDTIDSTEIRAVKGSMKQKECEVMEPETTENDEAINSAQDGDKEMMVKNEGNANVAGTNRLAEELQQREHQELADKSSIVLEISEEGKEKMLDVMESTEVIQVEESLKQREWDFKLENEIKDLGKDGGTDNDEATCSAQIGEKERPKHEGIPDATCSNRLTEVLPPREFQELAENSCVMPDISGEGNHKMLDITESTVIIPVEESLKQGELDVLEPEEKTKDVDIEGTIQNDKAMHSAQEGEKEMMVKNEGNVNLAGTNRLAEELQKREHQELAENSCAVLQVSEKGKEKLLDTMESTEIIQVEENLEQQEWDAIRLENEIKDSDKDGKTDNDAGTCSAQGGDKEMVKHEGIIDAACIDRLTEVLSPREYQELAENFSAEPDISEGGNHKMLDIRKSIIIIPVEGSLKQDECDVLEAEKKEGEANTIAENEGNADVEGDTVVTIKIAEGLPQSKHKELVENSTAMPEVSEKSKEKMLDKMKPTQIAVIGDNEEVKLQENMHLDNNTPPPEKVDQEAAFECIKNLNGSAKMPSNDENIGEPCQNSLPEEKDRREVEETTRISELQEEDGNSYSRNINIEVNILNEMPIQVDSSKVLVYPEIDEESHVQGNIGRKEAEVTSTNTSTTPLLDYIAARESPEKLREIMVSEDKSVQVVNKRNKDHEKEEDAADADTNTVSLLECETPHCSPDEATCNTGRDTEVVNLEKQEDNTEKAGVLLTGSFEGEQINTMEKIEQIHVTFETGSTQMVRTKAQGRSLEDEEKQKMIETVPVEMEKLDTFPFSELEKSTTEEASANDDSTDSNNILPLPQQAIMKSSKAAADNIEPSKAELKEAPHWEEKETKEEEPLASKPREAFSASLSDLLQASKKGIPQVTYDFPAEAEPNVEYEKMKDLKTERARDEEPKTDEEGEGDEDKRKESDNDSPVRVEAPSDTEMKAAHKSCNILSGVGSKVKRSIKKVKKAITGKSSHQKPHHQNKM